MLDVEKKYGGLEEGGSEKRQGAPNSVRRVEIKGRTDGTIP